jgi:hypothetical protein
MRVNRTLLYAGVFLLAIGAVLVAVDARLVDTFVLADALRLWPLALVAIGLAVIARRSRAALIAGMLAALLPGLALGGTLAVGPTIIGDCGGRGDAVSVADEGGRFIEPAVVDVTIDCGSLHVTTNTGDAWGFLARNTAGRAPVVESSVRGLTVDSGRGDGWHLLDGGRDEWDLSLPTAAIRDASLTVHAGRGDIVLPGADIDRLDLTVNAGEMILDASGASLGELAGEVNFGSLSVALSADDDLAGRLSADAGNVRLCRPAGLGLRVTASGGTAHVIVGGSESADAIVPDGRVYQSPGYEAAAHRADLDVNVDFGAIEIDPIGGCS